MAYTGCPLILTDMGAVEKVDSLSKAEREFLCSLLFYTINWFREVSTISPQTSIPANMFHFCKNNEHFCVFVVFRW